MVLFLNDSMCGGGAEKSMARIVNELIKEMPILLVSLEDSFCIELDNRIKTLYFNKKLNSKIDKIFSLFKDAIKLKKLVKKNKIKQVVSFQYRSNVVNILSKMFGSTHKVIISERNYPEKSLEYIPLFKRLVKSLYKKADLVIVNATDTKNLLEKWGINNTKLIFNGYDKERIYNLSQEKIEDKYLEIFNHKVIVNVGRLTYQKGQEYLIKSMPLLKDMNLLLIGEGKYKDKLKTLVKELKVENRVFFIGFQKNPYKFIKKADIFVFTSLYEGFPNALAEALILQKPIVSFDFKAGANDLVDNLVKIGDIDELVSKIKNPIIYKDKTKNIKEIAKEYKKVLDGK